MRDELRHLQNVFAREEKLSRLPLAGNESLLPQMHNQALREARWVLLFYLRGISLPKVEEPG